MTGGKDLANERLFTAELFPSVERIRPQARRLLETAGFGRQSGWKIGCTTKVMQAYLNIASPCAGTMFQAITWPGRHAFAVPPGREAETVARLRKERAIVLVESLDGRATP